MKARKHIKAIKLIGPCVWREVIEAWAFLGARWRWQILLYALLVIGGGVAVGVFWGGLVLWWVLT